MQRQHVDDVGPIVASPVAVAEQACGDRVPVGLIPDQDTAEGVTCARRHAGQRGVEVFVHRRRLNGRSRHCCRPPEAFRYPHLGDVHLLPPSATSPRSTGRIVMSASDEVEEMSLQHFWSLAAAFTFPAMLHIGYDSPLCVLPQERQALTVSATSTGVRAHTSGTTPATLRRSSGVTERSLRGVLTPAPARTRFAEGGAMPKNIDRVA